MRALATFLWDHPQLALGIAGVTLCGGVMVVAAALYASPLLALFILGCWLVTLGMIL